MDTSSSKKLILAQDDYVSDNDRDILNNSERITVDTGTNDHYNITLRSPSEVKTEQDDQEIMNNSAPTITDTVTNGLPLVVSRPTSGAKTEQDDTTFSDKDKDILNYSENKRTDIQTENNENRTSGAEGNITLSEECGELQQLHTVNDSEKLNDAIRIVAPDLEHQRTSESEDTELETTRQQEQEENNTTVSTTNEDNTHLN